MDKTIKPLNHITIDFFLDITEEICPMTFVKTKLLIEKMQPGQFAQVRLKGREPLENVPRSVRDYGHKIISLEKECAGQATNGPHRLILKKN